MATRRTSTNGTHPPEAPQAPARDVPALAERFLARFRGLERGHGHSELKAPVIPGEKQEAASAWVHEPTTVDHWTRHLLGTYGIGQTPIRDDGLCCFGAIDIDVYAGFDHVLLATKIDVFGLPLVVVRTKSGGAHLYLFLTEPAKASLVRGKLMEWAMALGYAGVEVFPKQTRLASALDYGDWLNMPYFGALDAETPATRYAILQSGDALRDPAAFLAHADRIAVTPASLERIAAPIDERHRDLLEDAPPCLVSLASRGFGKGGRNHALFDLGVYARKRFPDDWETRVDHYNTTFMDPPLPSAEVQQIIKHLRKKDYFYRCTQEPIVSACNKQICLTRKYGIGAPNDDPGVTFGALTKVNTEPPIWLWDVNGYRVQLTTQELMAQTRFNARVVDELNILPTPVKPNRWAEILREKLASVTIIEAPEESTMAGRVKAYLHQFLTSKKIGTDKAAAARGQPFIEKNRVYFSSLVFHGWLKREVRFEIDMRELWVTGLRPLGAEHHTNERCGGKVLNLWSVPVFEGLLALPGESRSGGAVEEI